MLITPWTYLCSEHKKQMILDKEAKLTKLELHDEVFVTGFMTCDVAVCSRPASSKFHIDFETYTLKRE